MDVITSSKRGGLFASRTRWVWRIVLCTIYELTISCVFSPGAHAVNTNSGDYIALPEGTNLLIGYLNFSHADGYSASETGKVNARLDSEVGLLRYVHYTKIYGLTIDPQFIIPFGAINNVNIDGQHLNHAFGAGDPIIACTIWPVNRPATKTYLGITPLLTIPLGQYNPSQAINFGGNRWSGNLQAGFQTAFASSGVGNRIRVQLYGDLYVYGNNNRASGHHTLSQNNVWQFQPFLTYDLDSTQNVSFGMSFWWGGRQYIDRVYNGTRTREAAIRFEYQKIFAKTWQITFQVTHDLDSRDNFRQDIGVNARILKIF